MDRRAAAFPRALAALAAAAALASPTPALAEVEGPCTASFNGTDPWVIDSSGSPLEIDAGEILTFAGTDPSGTTRARVEIVLGGVTVRDGTADHPSGREEFSAALDTGDVAPYGVGLYRIRGTTDGCTVEAWVRITGRFPLTTFIGLTAAGLTLVGLALAVTSVAARWRSSVAAAGIGGLFAGAGGAVLVQQFALFPLTLTTLPIAAGGAGLIGAALAALRRRRDGGGRDGARDRRRAERYRARLEEKRREAEQRASAVREDAPAARETPAGDAEPDDWPAEDSSATPAAEEWPSPGPEAPHRPEAPAADRPVLSSGPAWCYVLAPADVYDLADHTRTVGIMEPGKWYLARRRVGAWVQVAFGDGTEGWVAHSAVHTQD